MDLRLRLRGMVILALMTLFTSFFLATNRIISIQRDTMEAIEADQHLLRVQSALAARQAAQRSALQDYARWDDTWRHLAGEYPTYAEDALSVSSLSALDAEALSLGRLDGALLTELDPEDRVDAATWARWRARLGTDSRTAWVVEDGEVWLLASEAVTRSDGSGTVEGSAISARRASPVLIAQIGDITLTDIALSAAPAPAGAAETAIAGEAIAIAAPLPALTGEVLLTIRAPRSLNTFTQRIRLTLLLSSLLGSGVLGVLVLVILEQRFLVPIDRLRAEIDEIQQAPRSSLRLTVPPFYSIRRLVEAFNHLLDTLADQNHALQEARRAAEASVVARTRFLATMSHEIRTPLHGILGSVALLHRMPLPDDAAALIQEQRAAATALLAVLNDVLDFAKIEANHLDLEEKPLDLVQVIRETLPIFASVAVEKHLLLEETPLPAEALPILGDATRIRQIVMNLLGNAVKFTPPHGRIQVFVEEDSAGEWLEVGVRDSGVGIPATRLAAIFDPFTQADSTYNRRFGGTGLGLTISRQLAVAMGGDLTVHSVEGEGATFRLRLPRRMATLAPEADPAESIAPMAILLVEDNLINQFITRRLLEVEGHHVTVASHGREAVAQVLARPFDLVLMDLQMPEWDGFEATQRLRDAGSEVYIAAFSANTSAADRAACALAGMQGHLAKPCDRDALQRVLREAQAHNYAKESVRARALG